jgi:hypothetical protein
MHTTRLIYQHKEGVKGEEPRKLPRGLTILTAKPG